MEISTLLAYLQAPLLTVLFFLYLKYKFSISTMKYLLRVFAFGIGAIVVLVLFDLIIGSMGYDQLKNLKRSGFYSFVVVGFGSELGKFIVLRYFISPMKRFNGPLDGVIYGITIGLGFAAIGIPLFLAGAFSSVPGSLFIFTYPLASIVFGIIMGFFVGMGKYRKNRLIDSLTGLGAASFFHGFYYFANLTSDKTILIFYGVGIFLIALLLAVKSINVKESDKAPGK